MKLRQLLIVKLEFPIDDSGQKLSNVNAALEKLIVCPTQLPTIHVRNYALLLYYIRMEIKHISLKNMDAGYTFIVVNYIYIYTHTHTHTHTCIHARAHIHAHTLTHAHTPDDGNGMGEIRGAHIWGDTQRWKIGRYVPSYSTSR